MTGVALGVVVLLLRPHRRLLLVHRPHSRGVSRVEPRVGQTAVVMTLNRDNAALCNAVTQVKQPTDPIIQMVNIFSLNISVICIYFVISD